MQTFKDIDLRTDPAARAYVKDEIVNVSFASQPGFIISREGPNHYAIGDALITGSTGDHWSVTRDRFDAKYVPVNALKAGEAGTYKNKPIPVLAKQISTDFQIQRTAGGDLITGHAGDWLMQYAPGDHGIVAHEKFCKVYQLIKK